MESKICSKCKLSKSVLDFYMRSGTDRRMSHCISCKKEAYQIASEDPSFMKEKTVRSQKWQKANPMRARYLIAKSLALNPKRRSEKEFTLSFEEITSLWSKGCHYCKTSILEKTGLGLDRKDNSKGYTSENVLPCCGSCNKVRNTVLTVEEMEVAMAAVLALRGSSGAI